MTGRHEGPVLPTDIWIHDQLTALLDQIERYFDDASAATERQSSLTTEQVWRQVAEQSARKTALLCTARQLVGEVLRRG